MDRGFCGLLGILLLGMTGCGGDGVSYYEVRGTVRHNGVPLDKIQVDFYPASKGQPSVAITNIEGNYVLQGPRGIVGAAVGKHQVVLRDTTLWGTTIGRFNEGKDLSLDKDGKRIVNRIPKSKEKGKDLGDIQATPLELEVVSGKNTIDIELSK